MLISGPYRAFAHLETLYLGVLARRTRVATNTRLVVEAAWPKPVMFFPARFDHWLVQTGDGYAAHIAGAIGVSTDAQASWWGSRGIGTVPHALIAAFGGDTVAATLRVRRRTCRRTSRSSRWSTSTTTASARRWRSRGRSAPRLSGVRLDTSEAMVDRVGRPADGRLRPARRQSAAGPCASAAALDAEGSSTSRSPSPAASIPEKIRRFEAEGVPVDSYGVGSSLFAGRFDFTADIVHRRRAPSAKRGRAFRPNPRLEPVE